MPTQRPAPRAKPPIDAAKPAAQQSSAQAMSGDHPHEADRLRDALDNQGTQGRHPSLSMREEEDDDTATRH